MQAAPARPPVATASGRRLSLVLGVILAVVAFLGVALLAIYVSSQNSAGNVTVVVTTRDVAARETFTTDMLTTMSVPSQGVQPGHYTKASDLVNQSAAVPIQKGQQVTSNMLFVNNGLQTATSAYLPVPQGWVGLQIPTGELQGIGGHIQAGDYINVITTIGGVSKTTFTNIRVIAIGPVGTGSGAAVTSSLSVIVTQCDAEYLAWLYNENQPGIPKPVNTYSILSYKDYGPAPNAPVASCPPTTSTGVQFKQVDARWHFSSV